jgi:protein-S-isoprenylcysteine O-methyltransferase Ste14
VQRSDAVNQREFRPAMKYGSTWGRHINGLLAIDLIERVIVAVFFGFFVHHMLETYVSTGAPAYLFLMLSELVVVGFILVRRTTSEVSLRPGDWTVAVAATTLPLLITGGGKPFVSASISVAVMLMGLVISIGAKLSLQRSFGVVAANRGVKTGGAYYFVRHPMYFGYLVTQVGFILFCPTLWNVGIYAAALVLQLVRIIAEERILFKDPEYRKYAAKIRYRLVPGVF